LISSRIVYIMSSWYISLYWNSSFAAPELPHNEWSIIWYTIALLNIILKPQTCFESTLQSLWMHWDDFSWSSLYTWNTRSNYSFIMSRTWSSNEFSIKDLYVEYIMFLMLDSVFYFLHQTLVRIIQHNTLQLWIQQILY